MARWARAKLTQGDVPGALATSRMASSLAFGPELLEFRVAEVLFQVRVMREAGYEAAALELLGSTLGGSDLDASSQFALHAAAAHIHLSAGRVDTAAIHIDEATRCAQSPGEMISLLSLTVTAQAPVESPRRGSRFPLYEIRVFGGLEISVAGRPVDLERWRKNKARALFLSVVLEQGRDVSRDLIMERLWPRLDARAATNNYYVTWNGVKRLLSECVAAARETVPMPIANSGQRCSLRRDLVKLDLDAFDAACVAGRTARATGDSAGALDAYTKLKSIYRGDLLPGDTGIEWLVPYREYYRGQFVDAMGLAARTAIDAKRPGEAHPFITRGLSCDRFAEALYELSVEASIEAGHRDEGIRAYLRCRSVLAEEYGLDPSKRMQSLYRRLLEMER